MRTLLVLLLFCAFAIGRAQSDTTDAFIGLTKKQLYNKLGKPYLKKGTTRGEALIYDTPGIVQIHSSPYNTDGDDRTIIQEAEVTTFYIKKGRVYAIEHYKPVISYH